MSKYTYEYLAANVKATTFNGTRLPWWAKGDEPNLYPGPVPFEVVHEQLASWEPTISRMLDEDKVIKLVREGQAGADLIARLGDTRVASHKLVKTDDGEGVIGIDNTPHLYGVWLTGTVQELLGDEAIISSSGLLDNKMQAWVCIERPQPATGPGGVRVSPFIMFSTSYNGSWSTQENQNAILPICDNTATWARSESIAFKHTAGSAGKLGTYRSVAQALIEGETKFTAILEKLAAVPVSEKDYERMLSKLVPIDKDDKPAKQSRSRRVRQEITQLYRGDDRMAAMQGTGFGFVQAVNTWKEHMSTIVNRTGYEMDDTNLRAMRQYGERARPKMYIGNRDTFDQKALKILLDSVPGGKKLLVAA